MCAAEIYKGAANPNIPFSYMILKPPFITEDHLASCYDTREMVAAFAGSCIFANLCALENDFSRALQT